MAAAESLYMSYEEFLDSEDGAPVKHEWHDGVVYAMSGGTVEHGRLSARMTRILGNALAGECTVCSSDVAIYVAETKFSTYPDGSVICAPFDVHRGLRGIGEAVTNPTLLLEVLSESTESYDRGEKFAHYMRIPSLKEYVLVSQVERCIEIYRRPKRGHWLHEIARPGQTFELHGRAISVDDVYRT